MDTEQRKAEIRGRLLKRAFERERIEFTEENDHNPKVYELCPRCGGKGETLYSEELDGVITCGQAVCPQCSGVRTTGRRVPYFDNNTAAQEAQLHPDGWVKCPNCRWRFSTHDPNRWTGRRHRSCGQKITLIPSS